LFLGTIAIGMNFELQKRIKQSRLHLHILI